MRLLYAYCLCDEAAPGMVEGEAGVGGARVRALRFGPLAAVVSETEGERVAPTRENVLAHNRVNARVLARVTPLPFRFGTLADEARLAAYVEEHRAELSASLARVRGAVEMSVKVIRRAEDSEQAGRREGLNAGRAAGGGSGTAYLLSKREAQAADESLKKSAEEVAAWLAGRLGDAARESRVELCPAAASNLLVRAAHLVERGRLEEYRARLAEACAERGGELRFLTSGAWPPYSFSDARP